MIIYVSITIEVLIIKPLKEKDDDNSQPIL